MKRRWSLLAILPFTVACAAVLGLEEAELDEESEGGKGGMSSGGACGYEGGGACFEDCVNGMCCAEAQNCFELPACSSYVDCRSACEPEDAACLSDCGKAHPIGLTRFSQLLACTFSCGCPSAEGGAGGAGGAFGGAGGRTPSEGGAGGARAGAGQGGSATPPMGGQAGSGPGTCEGEPSTCPTSTSVRYCAADGTFQTATCSRRCSELGFDLGTGQCTEGICRCGDAIDIDCVYGMAVSCDCYAVETGLTCTPLEQTALYVACYQEEPTYGVAVRCMASYYDSSADCETIELACTSQD